MACLWSEKPPKKFSPLRSYPGSPFDEQKHKQQMLDPAGRLGGYRSMTLDEAKEWARSRGLPV